MLPRQEELNRFKPAEQFLQAPVVEYLSLLALPVLSQHQHRLALDAKCRMRGDERLLIGIEKRQKVTPWPRNLKQSFDRCVQKRG